MIFQQIRKLADKLDESGYTEYADELDLIIEAAAGAKTAATLPVRRAGQLVVPVKEDTVQNQYLLQTPDGKLTVSSPIFQNNELRQAGNKQPGVAAMKTELAKRIPPYESTHPGIKVVVTPSVFNFR